MVASDFFFFLFFLFDNSFLPINPHVLVVLNHLEVCLIGPKLNFIQIKQNCKIYVTQNLPSKLFFFLIFILEREIECASRVEGQGAWAKENEYLKQTLCSVWNRMRAWIPP